MFPNFVWCLHRLNCTLKTGFPPQRHIILELLLHFDFASYSGIGKRKIHHLRLTPFIACLQISLRWSLRPPLLVTTLHRQSRQRVWPEITRLLVQDHNPLLSWSVFDPYTFSQNSKKSRRIAFDFLHDKLRLWLPALVCHVDVDVGIYLNTPNEVTLRADEGQVLDSL